MEDSKYHSQPPSSEDPSQLRFYTSNVDIHGSDHLRDPNSDAVEGGGGVHSGAGSNSAKYKLMSPAKLPISRSTSITIPTGLSPTSFLESPVLLSNIKVEPSPTTGSLFKPQLMHGFGDSAAFSFTGNCSNGNSFDEQKSSCFEFKPHTQSNTVAGKSSAGPSVSTGLHQQKSERSEQVHDYRIQSFQSLPLNGSYISASKESNQSAPVNMLASRVSVPAGVDHVESNQSGHANMGNEASQSDHKDAAHSVTPEKSSDDGYNWRKYGQKLVKGCEFPRSYYKCTHPNCEVKKIFERSHDGQIREIVYKGTHDHPKPQPSRRCTAGALMSIQEEKTFKASSLTGEGDYSTIYAQNSNFEANGTPLSSPRGANTDSVDGTSPLLSGMNDEIDEEDQFSKRRKTDIGDFDVTPVVKPIREPRVVVQTLSEVDILDDGYRWRKYGQKVVRGNPNPRSYYKCTNAGCPVRKHVERASHDPKAVITTYEGKHNHDVPIARSTNHDVSPTTANNGMQRIISEESDTISLDLGVGIKYGTEDNTYEQQYRLDSEHVRNQVHDNTSNLRVVSSCYGVVNGGLNLHGSRENRVESHSFEAPSIRHSSSQYPQNIGSVLLGP